MEIKNQNGLEEGADGIVGVSTITDALYSEGIIDSYVVAFSPSENGGKTQFVFGGINQDRMNSSIHWVGMSSINNT